MSAEIKYQTTRELIDSIVQNEDNTLAVEEILRAGIREYFRGLTDEAYQQHYVGKESALCKLMVKIYGIKEMIEEYDLNMQKYINQIKTKSK